MTHEQATHIVLTFYSEFLRQKSAADAVARLKYVISFSFNSYLMF